jgi:hypothetical protein
MLRLRVNRLPKLGAFGPICYRQFLPKPASGKAAGQVQALKVPSQELAECR